MLAKQPTTREKPDDGRYLPNHVQVGLQGAPIPPAGPQYLCTRSEPHHWVTERGPGERKAAAGSHPQIPHLAGATKTPTRRQQRTNQILSGFPGRGDIYGASGEVQTKRAGQRTVGGGRRVVWWVRQRMVWPRRDAKSGTCGRWIGKNKGVFWLWPLPLSSSGGWGSEVASFTCRVSDAAGW